MRAFNVEQAKNRLCLSNRTTGRVKMDSEEAEQFPESAYRADDSDVVVLLFGSGKSVMTGGSRPEDAEHTIEIVASKLQNLGLE